MRLKSSKSSNSKKEKKEEASSSGEELNLKKTKTSKMRIFGRILLLIFCFFSALLYTSTNWMFSTWAAPTLEELVFIIKSPVVGTNSEMLLDYAIKCALPSAIFLIIAMSAVLIFRRKKTMRIIVSTILFLASATLCGLAIGKAWTKMDFSEYFVGQTEPSEFIEENYVDPNSVKISFPEKKRNLIYIFLESIEVTFADKKSGGAFDKNVIPELSSIADENIDFRGTLSTMNGARVLPGTTWTIAGMFAQTAGLPLKVSINGNTMNTQESFFSGVTALGDILDAHGYKQNLLIGSDATFGGRRLYYTDHGNFDIYDYVEAREHGRIPRGYRVWWGFEDNRLFYFAQNRLKELSKADEPFHLTILTVDTHFEDGYVCESCRRRNGANVYADVMECSSRKVSALIDWIKKQPFYENTTIILSGDHLTMDKDFCDDVDESYNRKTYTAIINSAVQPVRLDRISYSTLDMFPTTLASLGVKIEGDRLGLGTNLFSAEKTLLETLGFDTLKTEISKKSELMERLANIDGKYDPKNSPQPQEQDRIINNNSNIISGTRIMEPK